MGYKEEFFGMLEYALNNKSTPEELEKANGGFVYFVYEPLSKLVKIGRSKNVYKRLLSLSTSSPYDLTLINYGYFKDADKAEKSIHKQLAKYRVKGEWFNYLQYLSDNGIKANCSCGKH
jgi:hypothetical protein